MSFTSLNLNENINKAIAACGYTQPTPIQAQAIPPSLERKDIIACAETGSGKTAAFVLPALHLLSTQEPVKKTRVLILTPTRELAAQITKAAALYGKFLRYNIVSLVGGMSYHHQIKDLNRGADIIVATPGRLLDHIQQNRVNLSGIEMLVLDEADRMLDMGFIDDVEYIAKLTPQSRQTLLFSATIDKKLATVVKNIMKNPVRIDLSHERIASPQIKQELYKVKSPQHKARLLKHFLNDGNMYKAIIFSATKINADRLANQLCDDGFSAAALHGDLRQNVRNRTIEQLRRGKIQYLVATDVAARGIDIADLTHVINYDLPRFCEDYVHRIGRTGRAGKTGTAISFVLPTDQRHLQNIERYLGQRIQLKHADDLGEVSSSRDEHASEPRREFAKSHRSSARQDSNGASSSPYENKKRYGRESADHNDAPPRKHGTFTKRSIEEATPFRERESGLNRDSGDKPGYSRKKPAYKANTEKRFGSGERSDSGSRFGSGERSDSGKRFGSDKRSDSGSRFGSGERSDSGKRFGSDKRSDSGSRFGSDKRSDSGNRFGSDKRSDSGNRFSSDKRSDSGSRFGSDKRSDSGSRFGSDKRSDSGNRFGSDKRSDSGSRFGSDKRSDSGNRFGSDKRSDSGSRFGSDKRSDSGSRFGSDKRSDSGSRFGSDKRSDSGNRFGSDKPFDSDKRKKSFTSEGPRTSAKPAFGKKKPVFRGEKKKTTRDGE